MTTDQPIQDLMNWIIYKNDTRN